MYTQAFLRALSHYPNGAQFRRISEELERETLALDAQYVFNLFILS